MFRPLPNLIRCCAVTLVLCVISAAAVADETDKLALAPRSTPRSPQAAHRTVSPTELLGNSTFRTVASGLAIVLGVFALLTAVMRTQQDRRQSTALLQTMGAIQITPKVQLHVVRFGNRLLVLHLTADAVERVAEIADPEEVATLLGLHNRELQTGLSPQVEQLLRAASGVPLTSQGGGAAR